MIKGVKSSKQSFIQVLSFLMSAGIWTLKLLRSLQKIQPDFVGCGAKERKRRRIWALSA